MSEWRLFVRKDGRWISKGATEFEEQVVEFEEMQEHDHSVEAYAVIDLDDHARDPRRARDE